MNNRLYPLCVLLGLWAACTQPEPWTSRQTLLLPGGAVATANGYASVQRWTPDGSQFKNIRDPEESTKTFLLPDRTGVYIRAADHLTLVEGTERYSPLTLTAPDLVAAVMPTLGNAWTLDKQGHVQGWQWNQMRTDAPVTLQRAKTAPPIEGAVFSPDGSALATWGVGESLVRLWNAKTGVSNFYLPLQDRPTAVLWNVHPDKFYGSALLVSGLDGQVTWLANPESSFPTLIGTFSGHEKGVQSLAAAKTMINFLSGDGAGTVRVWGRDGWFYTRLKHTFHAHEGAVESVSLNEDENTVSTIGSDGKNRLWDLHIGKVVVLERWINGKTGGFFQTTLSADASRVAATNEDQRIRVWNVASLQPTFATSSLTNPLEAYLLNNTDPKPVQSLGFVDTPSRIASGHSDGTVRLWKLGATGDMEKQWQAHSQAIVAVAYAAPADLLITASQDKTIALWQPNSPYARQGTLTSTSAFRTMHVSATGTHLVAVDTGHTVHVWDIHDPQNIVERAAFAPNSDAPTDATLSADAQSVILTTEQGSVQVWSLHPSGPPTLQQSWVGDLYPGKNPLPASTHNVALCERETLILAGTSASKVKGWARYTGQLTQIPFSGYEEPRSIYCIPQNNAYAFTAGYRLAVGTLSSTSLRTEFAVDP